MKTVLRNAKIYTSNEKQPWAEAIVIEGKNLVYVGKDDENALSGFMEPDTRICDLGGRYVYPGIIDSHIHPGMVSQSGWHVRLPWTEDLGEIQGFIKNYARQHPKEEIPFLYFEYYPTSLFGAKGPHKKYLDEACSDRPVMCQDFGEHQHWYNSAMLEAMGITADVKDPSPGLQEFVRDENGEPTGWGKELVHTREPFTTNLYRSIGWEPPVNLTPEIMTPFFEFLKGAGITAIGEGILEGEAQIKSMYELDRAGKLCTYYDGLVRYYSLSDLPEKIGMLKEFQKYTTEHIKINTMKLFLDGTNEAGNAGLLYPQINDPAGTNYGEIAMSEDDLTECFQICNREGVDMHIHIVGDRSFRVACNAVERAQKETAAEGGRWIIQPVFAHCELVDPADVARPAQLGITINWSCHWSGGYFGEEALTFLPKEAWDRMYQFNPIIDTGALVTLSSDVVTFYELHRADPFFGMQVAATRIDPEFPLDPCKYEGSVRPLLSARLDVSFLLKGYTINGAKQMHWENKLGSLEVGKIANLNICAENIERYPASRLSELTWDVVFFEGRPIHGEL